MTIFVSGGLGRLQMVSEEDIRWCVNEDARPQRGMDTVAVCQQGCWAPKGSGLWIQHRLKRGTSVSEDAEPRRGWIVRCHVGWGGERNNFYKGVETLT